MDFSLSETQREVQEIAVQIFNDFTTQPRLRECDATGYFNAELWRTLAEAGLLGIAIDETNGGMGLDFETLCVLLEEAGRCVAPVPLLPVLVTAALPLQKFASAASIAPLLSQLASGSTLLTAALYEQGQLNPLLVSTRAVEADGWRLHGAKQCVPVAEQASHCWTLAMIGEEIAVFLIDLRERGVALERQVTTTGEYESSILFNAVPAQLLVRGDTAKQFVEFALQVSMTASAALAVGLCEGMIKLAASYTSERQQFGRSIATFQAVAHRLADCHIDKECLRAVTEQAICRVSADAGDSDAREAALTAKIWAADALHRISHGTQQVHGGAGVDRDYPLFRYCLWAKKIELAFGGGSQLLQQLGRELVAA